MLVKVLIPTESTVLSLLWKLVEDIISTLSTFSLGTLVSKLCSPPPLVVILIVEIPDKASLRVLAREMV